MSDATPFGTQQHFHPGKTSAVGKIGGMVGALGKKALDTVRGNRNLQKQWEFAASLHAHNEGISHHYEMQRMQAGHEMEMTRMKEGGKIQRMNVSHSGRVGQKNLEHAAGIVKSMPGQNVSMEAGADGGFKMAAQKAPASRQPKAAAPKPEATQEPSSSPAKPPTTRDGARQMSTGAKSGSAKAAAPQGVTTPRKTRTPKPVAE